MIARRRMRRRRTAHDEPPVRRQAAPIVSTPTGSGFGSPGGRCACGGGCPDCKEKQQEAAADSKDRDEALFGAAETAQAEPQAQPAKAAASPCAYTLKDREFMDADCTAFGNKLGGGKLIEWTAIEAKGSDCPKDKSGIVLEEEVTPIENTCPTGVLLKGLGCKTNSAGKLERDGGSCLDAYRVCFTFENFCRGVDPFDCARFLPLSCSTKVRQDLKLNGVLVKSRIITVTVHVLPGDPLAHPRSRDFVHSYAVVTYTP